MFLILIKCMCQHQWPQLLLGKRYKEFGKPGIFIGEITMKKVIFIRDLLFLQVTLLLYQEKDIRTRNRNSKFFHCWFYENP